MINIKKSNIKNLNIKILNIIIIGIKLNKLIISKNYNMKIVYLIILVNLKEIF